MRPHLTLTVLVLGGVTLLLAAPFSACAPRDPLAPSFATSNGSLSGGAPTNLTATAASDHQIWLAWQDNSTNEDGWEVYRSTTGPTGTFTLFTVYPWPNITAGGNDLLQGSTEYCYEVRAYKGARHRVSYSDFSNVACATTAPLPPLPPPDAPYATKATPRNSTTVDVMWSENSSRDGFRIERSLDLGATWTALGTLSPSTLSFSDAGRTAEQQVCYRVFAFNLGGDSPASNTDCTAPAAAPTGLTATGRDGPAVDLAWTDNSTVETQYEVQRSADGLTFTVVGVVPSNATTYTDGGMSENTTYWYAVRARKDGGFSDLSNVASARAGLLTPPAAPSWLSADGYFLGTIFLSWFDASSNEDGFKVERCQEVTCGDADFTLIAITGANVPYYQDQVAAGTVYTYRVRATNRLGDSAPSNLAYGRTCVEGVDWESPCWP